MQSQTNRYIGSCRPDVVKGDFAPFATWVILGLVKTGLSPPKFEIALKERGGSILVLGLHGTSIVPREFRVQCAKIDWTGGAEGGMGDVSTYPQPAQAQQQPPLNLKQPSQ